MTKIKMISRIRDVLRLAFAVLILLSCSTQNERNKEIQPQEAFVETLGDELYFSLHGTIRGELSWVLEDTTKGRIEATSKNGAKFKAHRPGVVRLFAIDSRDTCEAKIKILVEEFPLPPQPRVESNVQPLQFKSKEHQTPHRVLGSPFQAEKNVTSVSEAEDAADNFIADALLQLPAFQHFYDNNTVEIHHTAQSIDSAFYVNSIQKFRVDDKDIKVYNTHAQVVLKGDKILQYGIDFFPIDSLENGLELIKEEAVQVALAQDDLDENAVDDIQAELLILAKQPRFYLAYKIDISYWHLEDDFLFGNKKISYRTATFFIHASTGEVLRSFSKKQSANVYGEQPFKFLQRAIPPDKFNTVYADEILQNPLEHQSFLFHIDRLATYLLPFGFPASSLDISYFNDGLFAFYASPNKLKFGIGDDPVSGKSFKASQFSDIIYHEFTHAIIGWHMYTNHEPTFMLDAIKETYSDFWACYINSILPHADKVQYSEGIVDLTYRDLSQQKRTMDDYIQLANFEHYNSLILSPAIWDVRRELLLDLGLQGGNDQIARLVASSMLTHPTTFQILGCQLMVHDSPDQTFKTAPQHYHKIRKSFSRAGIDLHLIEHDQDGPVITSAQNSIECMESGELIFNFSDLSDIDKGAIICTIENDSFQIKPQNLIDTTFQQIKLIVPYTRDIGDVGQNINITLFARDSWGTASHKIFTLPVSDSTPPIFEITNKKSENGVLKFYYEIKDNCSDSTSLNISINGQTVTMAEDYFSISLNSLPPPFDGKLDITGSVSDQYGNAANISLSVELIELEFEAITVEVNHLKRNNPERLWDLTNSTFLNGLLNIGLEYVRKLGYDIPNVTKPDIQIFLIIGHSNAYVLQTAGDTYSHTWHNPTWHSAELNTNSFIVFDSDPITIKIIDSDDEILNPNQFDDIGQWSGTVNDIILHSTQKFDNRVESFHYKLIAR